MNSTIHDSEKMQKLDFLIIGAQKAATTFLSEQLRHSGVAFLPRDEVAFFEDPDYGDGNLSRLYRYINDAPREALVGIKRPSLIGRPEAAARIARHFPAARIIAVLRNPVDRAVSAYFHLLRFGSLPIEELNIGLRKILTETSSSEAARQVLQYGLYAKYLRPYFEIFPRDQILVLRHDALLANPELQMARTFAFLGVDPLISFGVSKKVVNGGLYSYKVLRIIAPLMRARMTYNSSWHRYYRRKGISGSALHYGVGALIKGVELCAGPFLPRSAPMLSGDTRAALRRFYQQDICEAEALTGIDLSDWRR